LKITLTGNQKDEPTIGPKKHPPEQTEHAPEKPFSLDAFAAALSDLAYCREHVVFRELEAIGAEQIVFAGGDPKSMPAVSPVNFLEEPRWRRRPAPFRFSTEPLRQRYGTVMIACVHQGRAWVAFRGTDDWDDWAKNFRTGLFTHPGFRSAWKTIRDKTLDVATSLEGHPLVITGHSLGGAIACLAAKDLAEAGHPTEAVVTFGAPRVGSPFFAKRWNATPSHVDDANLGDITRHYRTPGEAVCHVPPFLFGFKHLGHMGQFDHGRLQTHDNLRIVGARSGWIDRIRAVCLESFPIPMLPLLVLKALVFGIDRAGHHDMTLYFYLMNADESRFLTKEADRDEDYALSNARGSTLVLLFLIGLFAVAGLLWLIWFSFTATTVPAVQVLLWLVVGIALAGKP